MAKSNGNFYTVRDVINKGYSPLALRIALTAAKFDETLNFTWASMESAARLSNRLIQTYKEAVLLKATSEKSNSTTSSSKENRKFQLEQETEMMLAALSDSLNTPQAYLHINAGLKKVNASLASLDANSLSEVFSWFEKLDTIMGLDVAKYCDEEVVGADGEELFQKILIERNRAREAGDYTKSDIIRDILTRCGYAVSDKGAGNH